MYLIPEQNRPVRVSPFDMERMARQYRSQRLGEDLADLILGAVALVKRAYAAFLRWDERQQTIAALERLDNRCLADIGIAREEIPGFAAGQPARHDADEHLYVAGAAPVAANASAARRPVAVVAA